MRDAGDAEIELLVAPNCTSDGPAGAPGLDQLRQVLRAAADTVTGP
ncbi:hypothetical protein [Nonomuraea sp. NPDC049480]